MQVFLSYSHSDRPVAEAIRATLVNCGFEVWSDDVIGPGASVAESVAAGINGSDAVIVLLGRDTAGRQWSSLEIGGALASGKPTVPVLVDSGAQIPALLQDRKYLDLSDPNSRTDALARLCDAVRSAPSPWGDRRGNTSRLIEGASASLRLETDLWTRRVIARELRTRWGVLVASASSILAAAAVLIVAATAESAPLAAIGAGLGALVASAIGFFLGSVRERHASEELRRSLERLERLRGDGP